MTTDLRTLAERLGALEDTERIRTLKNRYHTYVDDTDDRGDDRSPGTFGWAGGVPLWWYAQCGRLGGRGPALMWQRRHHLKRCRHGRAGTSRYIARLPGGPSGPHQPLAAR